MPLISAWRHASGDPDDQVRPSLPASRRWVLQKGRSTAGVFLFLLVYTALEASKSPSSLLSEDLQGESMPATDIQKAVEDLAPTVKKGWIRRFASKNNDGISNDLVNVVEPLVALG